MPRRGTLYCASIEGDGWGLWPGWDLTGDGGHKTVLSSRFSGSWELASPPSLALKGIGLRRSRHMNVVINGDDHQVDGPITLSGLVERLGMKADRVAIELNLDIVPRDRWIETQLADGDRLEIVHFVGGGFS